MYVRLVGLYIFIYLSSLMFCSFHAMFFIYWEEIFTPAAGRKLPHRYVLLADTVPSSVLLIACMFGDRGRSGSESERSDLAHFHTRFSFSGMRPA